MPSSDNGHKTRRRVTGEKRRLNLKLDEELVEFAFGFAQRNGTTVTQIICDFLRDLRRGEEERLSTDAEQI